MTDGILDRLYSLDYIVGGHGKSMYAQAAAEIDRLRAANEDLDMVASLREQENERLRALLQEVASIGALIGHRETERLILRALKETP